VLQQEEEQRLRSLFDSPSIAAAATPEAASESAAPFAHRPAKQGTAVSDNRGNQTRTSFAEIAGGGGYFPTLGEASKVRTQQSLPEALSTTNAVSSTVWCRGAAPPAAAAPAAPVASQKSKKGNSLFSFG